MFDRAVCLAAAILQVHAHILYATSLVLPVAITIPDSSDGGITIFLVLATEL